MNMHHNYCIKVIDYYANIDSPLKNSPFGLVSVPEVVLKISVLQQEHKYYSISAHDCLKIAHLK